MKDRSRGAAEIVGCGVKALQGRLKTDQTFYREVVDTAQGVETPATGTADFRVHDLTFDDTTHARSGGQRAHIVSPF